ncbi:hypothetical protein [Microbacterium sp. P5_E9]
MGDEPSGGVTHAERSELDALRRRAYGPDADIHGDPLALARLRELEDRVRPERLAVDPARVPFVGGIVADRPSSPAPGTDPPSGVTIVETAPARARRWRSTLVAGAVAAAALIGAIAWSGIRSAPADDLPVGSAPNAAVKAQREVADQRVLDDLRDDVLALPGVGITKLLVRDELRPYGLVYGRTVGVGRTVDRQFCMIIADVPAASITCISGRNSNGTPVTVTLPAWYPNLESDPYAPVGELVSYTLMPGGSVVAVPAD